MVGVLRVFPHHQGPWLVQVGQVALGVPPDIGSRLQKLDGLKTTPGDWRQQLPADGSCEAVVCKLATGLPSPRIAWYKKWRRGNPVWVRLPLVPPSLMRRASRPLWFLTQPAGLALLGMVGAAGLILPRLVRPSPVVPSLDQAGLTLGIMIFLASALWHELGHAATLQAEGYEPGGLGLGMLYVLPVLFVDVTPVALLPKAGRLRVNLAGPLFQLAFAAVCQAVWLWLPLSPLWMAGFRVAAGSATLAVSWSLWPFIRSDGYWLVCDALGISGLDRALPPGLSRKKRVLIAGLRVANMAFLLMIGGMLTTTIFRRLGLRDGSGIFTGSLGRGWTVVVLVFLTAIWAGLVGRVFYFAKRLKADDCS